MNTITKYTGVGLVLLLQVMSVSALSAVSDYQNNPYAQQASAPASSYSLSEAELAQSLAPIALYPDSLLSHIMIASTYPLEIVQAQRWRNNNLHLDAANALEQAQSQGWDPSVTALIAFPSVLEQMNNDLQWTQTLGDAFLDDEERVLDTIQTLRVQAEQVNSLAQLENMRISKSNQQIIIEPVRQHVIYVPYYDTRVVYGNWRWRSNPPIHWDFRPHVAFNISNKIANAAASHFHWSAGVSINFDYFFSAFNWHSRHIVVTRHQKSRHYRSHSKMLSNYGAQRWQHQPSHRRGVGYRSEKANLRFKAAHSKNVYVKRRNDNKDYQGASAVYSSPSNKKRYVKRDQVLQKLGERQAIVRSKDSLDKSTHKTKALKHDRSAMQGSTVEVTRRSQAVKQVRKPQDHKLNSATQKVANKQSATKQIVTKQNAASKQKAASRQKAAR